MTRSFYGMCAIALLIAFFVNVLELFEFGSEDVQRDRSEFVELSANPTPQKKQPIEAELSERYLAPGPARNRLMVRFQSGDYGTALKIAEKQILDPSLSAEYKKWVEQQISAILTSLAWSLIHQGRCVEAVDYLKRSYKKSRQIETTKGLAFCYYKLKNIEDSEFFLSEYLVSRPSDDKMLLVQSEILESQGRYNEAVKILDKVVRLNPEEIVIKRLNSMKARVSEQRFQENVTSEFFSLTYRTPEHDAIVHQSIESLDAALTEFIELFAFQEPVSPLEVLFYPSRNFNHLVSYGPSWAKGLYDGRIRIQIDSTYLNSSNHGRLNRLLRHELFHALTSEKIDRRELPYWFSEGAAMLYECVSGCPSNDVLVPYNKGLFLKKEFFEMSFVELPASQAAMLYRQSFFMIQVLREMYKFSDEGPVVTILRSLNKQSPLSSDDLLEVLGMNFESLYVTSQRRWNR